MAYIATIGCLRACILQKAITYEPNINDLQSVYNMNGSNSEILGYPIFDSRIFCYETSFITVDNIGKFPKERYLLTEMERCECTVAFRERSDAPRRFLLYLWDVVMCLVKEPQNDNPNPNFRLEYMRYALYTFLSRPCNEIVVGNIIFGSACAFTAIIWLFYTIHFYMMDRKVEMNEYYKKKNVIITIA